jgi:hypothetical protein
MPSARPNARTVGSSAALPFVHAAKQDFTAEAALDLVFARQVGWG